MAALHVGITEQMRSLLEENGIDVNRCTKAAIEHDVEGRVTAITVTLLAVKQGQPS